MKQHHCRHCHGYGYVQVYFTVVMRVYCDCEAGDKRIQEMRATLTEAGLDPDDPSYKWTRRADIIKLKKY